MLLPFMRKSLGKVWKKVVPFPYVYGFGFAKFYNFLMESQWWPKDKLEELQSHRLREAIDHAYRNVSYYKRIFDERGLKPEDIQTKQDLKHLPILTKDDIRTHFDELQARDMARYKPYLSETGGSTGKPLKFYNDRASSIFETASVWRFRSWAGYGPRDRQVIMRYREFEDEGPEVAPGIIEGNILFLSAFHLRETNMKDYVRRMIEFRPKSIWAFPSTLHVLSGYMIREGIRIPDLASVTTSSESLFPWYRKNIKTAFGCPVFDWYGSNERVVSACNCPTGRYHVDLLYGVMEVLDKRGGDVRPGEVGQVVGTTLYKMAMPLIRYKLGDRVVPADPDEECPCGRKMPMLRSLEGRLDDIIITKDRRYVGRLDEAFHYSYGIKLSQIVQERVGQIVVRIVKGVDFSDDDVTILDRELRKRLGQDMEIQYVYVEDIPLVGRGKYRFVISKVPDGATYSQENSLQSFEERTT